MSCGWFWCRGRSSKGHKVWGEGGATSRTSRTTSRTTFRRILKGFRGLNLAHKIQDKSGKIPCQPLSTPFWDEQQNIPKRSAVILVSGRIKGDVAEWDAIPLLSPPASSSPLPPRDEKIGTQCLKGLCKGFKTDFSEFPGFLQGLYKPPKLPPKHPENP